MFDHIGKNTRDELFLHKYHRLIIRAGSDNASSDPFLAIRSAASFYLQLE
jgi:hypothetical protein